VSEALAYFLALRLQVRGSPEARAIVDRCLVLLARAEAADPETLSQLEVEVEALRAELAQRFGAPRPLVVH
jgi:hypothetical protein